MIVMMIKVKMMMAMKIIMVMMLIIGATCVGKKKKYCGEKGKD